MTISTADGTEYDSWDDLEDAVMGGGGGSGGGSSGGGGTGTGAGGGTGGGGASGTASGGGSNGSGGSGGGGGSSGQTGALQDIIDDGIYVDPSAPGYGGLPASSREANESRGRAGGPGTAGAPGRGNQQQVPQSLTARQMLDLQLTPQQIGQVYRDGRTTQGNAFSALGALGQTGAIAWGWLQGTATSSQQQAGGAGAGAAGGTGGGGASGTVLGGGASGGGLGAALDSAAGPGAFELTPSEDIQRLVNEIFGTQLNPAVRRGLGRTTEFLPDIFRLLNPQGTEQTFADFARGQLQSGLPSGGALRSGLQSAGSGIQNLLDELLTNPNATTLGGFFGPTITAAGLPRSMEVSPFFRDAVMRQTQRTGENLLLQDPSRFNVPSEFLRALQEAGVF